MSDLVYYHQEYPTYDYREEVKKKYWNGFESCTDREKVFRLLRGIIWAHYWRARTALEENPQFAKKVLKSIFGKDYCSGLQLSIDKYIVNWIHAMQYLVPPAVSEILAEEYGYVPVANKFLDIGHTVYHPLQNSERDACR